MKNTIYNTVRTYESQTLRHVRRVIEAEMLAFAATGAPMTQAHVGQLELMQACGDELHARNELLEPPPFVDVCTESQVGTPTLRLSFQIRVF